METFNDKVHHLIGWAYDEGHDSRGQNIYAAFILNHENKIKHIQNEKEFKQFFSQKNINKLMNGYGKEFWELFKGITEDDK